METEKAHDIVIKFLDKHRKAVLATVGEDEHPTTSLMLYAADANLNVFFGTRKSFGKWKIFKHHPFASLTVVEEKQDPLKAVEIRGKIEFVPEEETSETLRWFEAKNPSEYYIKDAEDFVMFKVVHTLVRWLDASSGKIVMEEIKF